MGLMLAFVLGVGCVSALPDPPDVRAFAAFTLILALGWRVVPRASRWRVVLRHALVLLLGFAYAAWQAGSLLDRRLDQALQGVDLDIVGVVASLPEQRGDSLRFMFDLEQASRARQSVPLLGRIRLSWFRDAPALGMGERWRLRVRLRRPHGFSNPGGFDYEAWLFREGVSAVGYVRPKGDIRLLGEAGTLTAVVGRWRQGLRDRLLRVLPDTAGGALLPALALGDRSGIPATTWEVLTRTGTNHLIAISGLHVGIVSGLVFWICRWVWALLPRLPLLLPARVAAAWGGLVSAVVYAALAGFSLPTQRALVMVLVVLGALVLRRAARPFRSLLLALVIILVLDPMAFGAVGLWLSFIAVAAIFYLFGARRTRPGSRLAKGMRLQLGISLAMTPALLGFMGQTSLVAPLVNLVAVPLFSVLLIPLALLATLSVGLGDPGDALVGLAATLLDVGYQGLAWAARTPMATWAAGQRPAWVWILAAPGILLLLLPRGLPGRWLGGILLLPLVLNRSMPPSPGEARFTLLDVGQGLAAVVETQRHTLVYDTGPKWSDSFDAGGAVLVPFLRHRDIGRLDRVILSHGDNDHSGGLQSLKAAVAIDALMVGSAERLGGESCRAGQQWEWDGVWFRILHPADGLSGNNRSCVLMVGNGAGRILLSGDIEHEAEAQLVARYGPDLAADVVVAPHHGSETSSSDEFIAATSPRFLLYPVGYRNRFGFPRPRVAQRWQAAGSVALDTASSGAISFSLGADGVLRGPGQHRRQTRRPWTDGP